jgi:hypothetical protein
MQYVMLTGQRKAPAQTKDQHREADFTAGRTDAK